MEALASVFAGDVLVYATLSNRIRKILRNRPDVVEKWTAEELDIRWLGDECRNGPSLVPSTTLALVPVFQAIV